MSPADFCDPAWAQAEQVSADVILRTCCRILAFARGLLQDVAGQHCSTACLPGLPSVCPDYLHICSCELESERVPAKP